MDAAPKYEITKSIAILSTEKNGWSKELNLVSWNDRAPKYDIRSWSPDHQKMGKGVTLSAEEIASLHGANMRRPSFWMATLKCSLARFRGKMPSVGSLMICGRWQSGRALP